MKRMMREGAVTATTRDQGKPDTDDIGVAPGEFGHCEPPDFTRRHPPRGPKPAGDEGCAEPAGSVPRG